MSHHFNQNHSSDTLFDRLSDAEIAAQLRKPHNGPAHEIAILMNKGNSAMNRHAIAVLNAQAGDEILEIGMGNGAFVSRITNVAPNIRYTGCDYSESMVSEAKELNSDLVAGGMATFVQGELQHLPFQNDSFDKVLTVNTLYFWDNFERCLSELNRVLRPDGHLILSIRPKVNMMQYPFVDHGFRLFDADEVIQLLEDSGFQDIERTSVQEPPQERGDSPLERSSLIFRARNHKT